MRNRLIGIRWLAASAMLPALIASATAPLNAQTEVSVDGIVESTSGGFRFPDGTIQTTAASGGPAQVEDTGRTTCFTASGNPRGCSVTGEDGEFQAGAAWATPRFIDHGDGTISDQTTGLMWLKDADCLGSGIDWQAALSWVTVTLNLSPSVVCTDYAAGTHQDWRLPNVKELESLVDYGQDAPPFPPNHPFVGAPTIQTFYWTSTSFALGEDFAWAVNLGQGGNNITLDKDGSSGRAWAVRAPAVEAAGGAGAAAQTMWTVDGAIESTSGGFRYPDGSLQATAAVEYPAPVEQTGATDCFSATGSPRSCVGSGEDGEYLAGAAWPSPRFVDLADGTILDQLTGLIWLKDANCLGATATWQGALSWIVATLNFAAFTNCTDYVPRTYRDWRLPNVKELMSLLDYGRWGPAVPTDHLFEGSLGTYWSSSTGAFAANAAWLVNLNEGRTLDITKTQSRDVLAVRGGSL